MVEISLQSTNRDRLRNPTNAKNLIAQALAIATTVARTDKNVNKRMQYARTEFQMGGLVFQNRNFQSLLPSAGRSRDGFDCSIFVFSICSNDKSAMKFLILKIG